MSERGGSDWESLLIEIHRFGAETGIPREEERYLVTCGDELVRTHESELTGIEFVRWMRAMRKATAQVGAAAIPELRPVQSEVTTILDLDSAPRPRQLDLVINHKEIAVLPFEVALAMDDNKPLLVGRQPPIVLTRRVRGRFQERTPPPASKPRVLFVSSAATMEIPLAEHKSALRAALSPWIEPLAGVLEAMPDERTVITMCEQASLADIERCCREASPPYTHVHVLAHGTEISEGLDASFGLLLAAEDGTSAVTVTAEELAKAVCAGATPPTVVTLTACDSGNAGSPAVTGASAAHAIHVAGVPVVVASQFPMTFSGSALTVETFYGGLLGGDDVRDALCQTRAALYDAQDETGEDWMSLIAYAQLPEGYQDRLVDVRLAADFASLKTAQVWADHLVANGAGPEKYDAVAERMRSRIVSLEKSEAHASALGRPELLEESRGLLGSANKRLAELAFRRAMREQDPRAALELSHKALAEGARWYARAFADNLAAHWVAVQELSLEAVVDGTIREPWRWHAALAATHRSVPAAQLVWQHGSRAELHLLAPYAGLPKQLDRAAAELTALANREDEDATESTRRQLQRYVDWWTKDNNFFPEVEDLSADAAALLRLLALP